MKDLLNKWLNRKVNVNFGAMKVSVVIHDVKERYGKVRFLVSPLCGKGSIWVESFDEFFIDSFDQKFDQENKPEEGKIYALTGGLNDKCIVNGNSWEESEVKTN